MRQLLKSWLLCGGSGHRGDGFTTRAKGWVWCTRCETHIRVRS